MQISEYQIAHLKVEKLSSLKFFLQKTLSLSETRYYELLKLGCIYKNHRRLNVESAEIELMPDETLRVHQNPRRFRKDLLKYPDCLFFECADFIIINKPSGLPVPPTVDNLQENLEQILSDMRHEQLYVTHRLDIATSGLIFFARTKDAQRKFNELLVNRKVKKLYRTFVSGEYLGEKTLTHYMKPSPRAPKQVSIHEHLGWHECRLRITAQKFFSITNQTELNIELLTGRTHQIRAQLATEGHPVIGDRLYGDSTRLAEDHDRIRLQSYCLGFNWNAENLKFEISTDCQY